MAHAIALHTQARRALRWLTAHGITPRAVKAAPRRPLIEIEVPTCPELWAGALEMTQTLHGLRRRVWAARVGGCVVTWFETPEGERA